MEGLTGSGEPDGVHVRSAELEAHAYRLSGQGRDVRVSVPRYRAAQVVTGDDVTVVEGPS